MEEASQVRRAAREAVEDVAPDPFREAVERTLEEGSVAPGVLAVLCARGADEEVAFAALAERAAGTQLIYDGLRLTRDLAHDPPWERIDERAAGGNEGPTIEDANVAVLVADVLVARGFYLLARTEAADRAVETVRAFGREETRDEAHAGAGTSALEADVFELAAVAGATAVGESPPPALRGFVTDRADDLDGDLPPAGVLFEARIVEHLGTLAAPVADGGSADEGSPEGGFADGNRNG